MNYRRPGRRGFVGLLWSLGSLQRLNGKISAALAQRITIKQKRSMCAYDDRHDSHSSCVAIGSYFLMNQQPPGRFLLFSTPIPVSFVVPAPLRLKVFLSTPPWRDSFRVHSFATALGFQLADTPSAQRPQSNPLVILTSPALHSTQPSTIAATQDPPLSSAGRPTTTLPVIRWPDKRRWTERTAVGIEATRLIHAFINFSPLVASPVDLEPDLIPPTIDHRSGTIAIRALPRTPFVFHSKQIPASANLRRRTRRHWRSSTVLASSRSVLLTYFPRFKRSKRSLVAGARVVIFHCELRLPVINGHPVGTPSHWDLTSLESKGSTSVNVIGDEKWLEINTMKSYGRNSTELRDQSGFR
ncbi:hypothetical protein C8R43DRAFT_964263 [Mycena crocata]|nr:hypothetical protein C8R43DRAFT_964263 [Mycena crocata]